jgi:P27 family predicted phage terminase small subunit
VAGNSKSGRKPKPTHLRVIQGNAGHRPLNRNEPKPKFEIPEPPAHLDDEARAEWARQGERLRDLGCLSKIDSGPFAAYCVAYSRWVKAELAIDKSGGLLIQTKAGNIIQNPLVGIANKSMADMVRIASEFGMTPSSRSRIDTEAAGRAQQKDPAEEFFDD